MASKKNGAQNGRRTNGTYAKGTNGGAHGKPGVSGRKPLAFKAECEGMVDALVLPKVRGYLTAHDPSDQNWRWCAQWATDHGKGKPAQTVVHEGNPDSPVQHEVALKELA